MSLLPIRPRPPTQCTPLFLYQNVASARDYIDELDAEIEDMRRKVDKDAREIGREAARHKVQCNRMCTEGKC